MQPTTVLATLTGRDRPGVTASVFAALAAYDVDVRDVEQIVVRNRLVLSVLFDLRGDPAALRGSLTKAASALGIDSEVVIADAGQPRSGRSGEDRRARTHVLLLGQLLRPGALGHVAQYIADLDANIESISRIADQPAVVLELVVRSPSPARLRGTLVRTAKDLGFDIAVQPAALRWRPKRLVLLDVTSTLLGPDARNPVAQLAERVGRGVQHGEIAERESAGELDCAAALRARAALLTGLPAHELARAGQAVPVREDVRPAVAVLRALGFHVGAVCSDPGFDVERLRDELRLDFVAGNRFEVRDDVLTGRLLEPLVDRAGKAAALVRFAEQHRVPLSQTVALGAGANDLDLLQTAGLAVTCTGAVSLLDSVRCVLGAGEDVREAAQAKR